MSPVYLAGIQWADVMDGPPIVNGSDVLALAPLTVLFGANDSGKSSTLRAVAEQLDGISRRLAPAAFSTAIVSFRHDTAALQAMATDLQARGGLSSPIGEWVGRTLTGQPPLFSDAATVTAPMLSGAPVFALDIQLDERGHPSQDGMWSVWLVASPPHLQELAQPLRAALEQLRDHERRGLEPIDLGFDPGLFGHPLQPWALGCLGQTSLPLIPRPLPIPRGVETALRALESSVERARCVFRAWSASVGLRVPDESPHNPWVDVDGMPDPFVIQLVGQLEGLSESLLPSFVSSTYRLDFDPSTPERPPGVTRLNARLSAVTPLKKHKTFAEKFPIAEVASGFQLWIELAIWELIAEVTAATASLQLAACDEITSSLSRPGAPTERLDFIRSSWRNRDLSAFSSWLCSPGERAWQLGMLADSWPDPRIAGALNDVARAVRPYLVLIDEPERHLNAAVVKDAARWLQRRAHEGRGQIVIATHSPAFLSCQGAEVHHVHVRRVSNGLIYTTFTPSDEEALTEIADQMGLDHGEIFGLTVTIVWVEGTMDRAALEALCGDELRKRGARIATFGGLGNIESILNNPIARLPNLSFLVLVDDLDERQLELVNARPWAVTAKDPQEMRRSAGLVDRAKASGRQLEVLSHGFPDIFLALSDNALTQIARGSWPGKDAVLRQAAEARVPKSKLKGFVADRYRFTVDEASCRYAAELTRRDSPPPWVADLLRAVDELSPSQTG